MGRQPPGAGQFAPFLQAKGSETGFTSYLLNITCSTAVVDLLIEFHFPISLDFTRRLYSHPILFGLFIPCNQIVFVLLLYKDGII